MSPFPTNNKLPQRDEAFARKVTGEVRNLNRCYQCSMCSDGCPVAYAMEYFPNQIIYMSRLGLKETALKSNSIWVCASCETCATRCPNEIEIVRLMDVLREEARTSGIRHPDANISTFHELFMNEVKRSGRVDEASLLTKFEIKSGAIFNFSRFLEEIKIGIKLFRKGKIKPPSWKKYSIKEVRNIYRKVFSGA